MSFFQLRSPFFEHNRGNTPIFGDVLIYDYVEVTEDVQITVVTSGPASPLALSVSDVVNVFETKTKFYDGFESGFSRWSEEGLGTLTNDGTVFKEGGKSAKFNCTTNGKRLVNYTLFPATISRPVYVSFWYYHVAYPTASTIFYYLSNTVGAVVTGLKMDNLGDVYGKNSDYSEGTKIGDTVTTATWHFIEHWYDPVTGVNYAKIDGGVATTWTNNTPTDWSGVVIGNLNDTTYVSYFDEVNVYESGAYIFESLPLINDSVTIEENVTIKIPTLVPSVFDGVTIAEDVTIKIPTLVPSVFDALGAISEDVTIKIPTLVPSIFDGVTIAEDVTIKIPTLVPSVFDGVSISEFVQIQISYSLPSPIFDTVTVTDISTILIPVIVPSVFDTLAAISEFIVLSYSLPSPITENVITVTDVPTIKIPTLVPSVFEALGAISEFIVLSYSLPSPIIDTVAITENITLAIPTLSIFVYENIVVSEAESSTGTLHLNVYDSLSISEQFIADLTSGLFTISVYDLISVEDFPGYHGDWITVTESVNISIPVLLSGIETVALTESVTITLSALSLSIYESISVEDFPGYHGDWITVSEYVEIVVVTAGQTPLSVSDTVSITESIVLTIPVLHITAIENLTVTEFVALTIPVLHITAIENLTVTEFVALTIPVLHITAIENLTVTESVSTILPTVHVSVTDTVAISENITIAVSAEAGFTVSVKDDININELSTCAVVSYINLYEEITVNDVVSISVPVIISITENISISENLEIFIPTLHISVFDTVIVSEAESSTGQLQLSVIDTIGINDVFSSNITSYIPISDTVTLTEFVDIAVRTNINLYEQISISEYILFVVNTDLFVYDNISLHESEQIMIVSHINVYELITISENYTWLRKTYGYDIQKYRPQGYAEIVNRCGEVDDPQEIRGYGTGY